MIDIRIHITSSKPKKELGVLAINGTITVGDHTESIYVPLDWWKLEDYEKQWQEGLDRLSHYATSCLVVSIHNPLRRPFIDWWILYKENSKVYVQNHILIADMYDVCIGSNSFTIETCYNFIPPRVTVSDDGHKISEWIVDWK